MLCPSFTQVQDLGFLVEQMSAAAPSGAFAKRHKKLTAAICEVVEDFGLVHFMPLAIEDKELVGRLLIEVGSSLEWGLKIREPLLLPVASARASFDSHLPLQVDKANGYAFAHAPGNEPYPEFAFGSTDPMPPGTMSSISEKYLGH